MRRARRLLQERSLPAARCRPKLVKVHTEEARLPMKTLPSFAWFASFAVLPILVLSACGGDSEFNSAREEESVAFDDLPGELAGAYCDLFARCAPIYSDILFSLEDCDVLFEE